MQKMTALLATFCIVVLGRSAVAEGDLEAGARVFRACAPCHSLVPGRHMTGPSLVGVWGRNAGTIEGFTRYSSALRSAGITWTAESLDPWLKNPAKFIPNSRMIFSGVANDKLRADVIAFLRKATAEPLSAQGSTPTPGGEMMRAPSLSNLKAVDAARQIASIRYCGDTYHVTTAAGETHDIWEFNLRFKTDSSDQGPPPGHPVLLPASMMGDRAFAIFASPGEITLFIQTKC